MNTLENPNINLNNTNNANETTSEVHLNQAFPTAPKLSDIQLETAQKMSQAQNIQRVETVDTITDATDHNGVTHKDVVVRSNANFEKNIGDGAGGYFSGKNGLRHHTTGTYNAGTPNNSSIVDHCVDKNNNVTLHSKYTGPEVYESALGSTIDKLGLVMTGDKTYSRPGYSGEYTIQIERDNSFSIHYNGGVNATGMKCHKQTFHHGRWDLGRRSAIKERFQKNRWDRYTSANRNRKASATVSKKLLGSSSSFNTSASSIRTNSEGKLIKTEQKLINYDFKNVTSNESTWSGTFRQESGYTLVCQHNSMSGALNIKQSTLDSAKHSIVREAFAMSINNNIQEQSADGEPPYQSLLTNQKMLINVDGKQTVVELMGNGDIKDHTNNNLYSIQVNEGEPISWIQKSISDNSQKMDMHAPKPMTEPDITEPDWDIEMSDKTRPEKEARPSQIDAKSIEENKPLLDRVETPLSERITPEATNLAKSINSSMNPWLGFDNESEFVALVNKVSNKNLITEVNHELKKLFNTSIQGIMASEGEAGVWGISTSDIDALKNALGDKINELPENKYEGAQSTNLQGISPSGPFYNPS